MHTRSEHYLHRTGALLLLLLLQRLCRPRGCRACKLSGSAGRPLQPAGGQFLLVCRLLCILTFQALKSCVSGAAEAKGCTVARCRGLAAGIGDTPIHCQQAAFMTARYKLSSRFSRSRYFAELAGGSTRRTFGDCVQAHKMGCC